MSENNVYFKDFKDFIKKVKSEEMREKLVKGLIGVVAGHIPVFGEFVSAGIESYLAVCEDEAIEKELDERFDDVDEEIDELEESIEKHGEKVEDIEETLKEYVAQIESLNIEFDEAKKKFVSKDEEYRIKNVKYIELFFADYIETNDGDFLDNLMDVLQEMNEDSTYGCRYEAYLLGTQSLRLKFDSIYTREYVDEYIEKIVEGIADAWHEESPVAKIGYYESDLL